MALSRFSSSNTQTLPSFPNILSSNYTFPSPTPSLNKAIHNHDIEVFNTSDIDLFNDLIHEDLGALSLGGLHPIVTRFESRIIIPKVLLA